MTIKCKLNPADPIMTGLIMTRMDFGVNTLTEYQINQTRIHFVGCGFVLIRSSI